MEINRASCFVDASHSPAGRFASGGLVAIIVGEAYTCTKVCYTFNIFGAASVGNTSL